MTEREYLARVGETTALQAYGKGSATRPLPGASPGATNSPAGVAGEGQAAVDPASLKSLVGEIQGQVQNVRRTLQFSVEEESGTTVIKVIDSETQELIRQIPAEEMLSMASRLRAAAGGLLLADTV